MQIGNNIGLIFFGQGCPVITNDVGRAIRRTVHTVYLYGGGGAVYIFDTLVYVCESSASGGQFVCSKQRDT